MGGIHGLVCSLRLQFYTQDSSVLKSAGKKANPALLVPCFQLKETTAEGWMNKMGQWMYCFDTLTHKHTHTHRHTYTQTHTADTHRHTRTQTRTHTHTRTHIHARTHTQTRTHTHACTHTHTHTQRETRVL